jgi:hypothetical protein
VVRQVRQQCAGAGVDRGGQAASAVCVRSGAISHADSVARSRERETGGDHPCRRRGWFHPPRLVHCRRYGDTATGTPTPPKNSAGSVAPPEKIFGWSIERGLLHSSEILALPRCGASCRSRHVRNAPLATVGPKKATCRNGRVEDRRGSLGHLATPRFPSSLIEPDVPISGIRLSDWFHRRAHDGAGVRGAKGRVLHRRHHRRSVWSRALPLCAVWRGSRARAHRHIGQRYGMPIDTSHGRSSLTSQAESCSACRALRATDRCFQALANCRPLS